MKARLLDLFCGAGGAAMGYHRAGFDVVGVDIKPQPHYPFEFVQADAIEYLSETLAEGFDAIHASPPCQRFSTMARATGIRESHPDLIPPTRSALEVIGLPWVIENVPTAPLRYPAMICGVSMGLQVIRHRLFESSSHIWVPPCSHNRGGIWTGQYVAFRRGKSPHHGRRPLRAAAKDFRSAQGVEWMTLKESSQAIPPAYTEWIGTQLLASLKAAA